MGCHGGFSLDEGTRRSWYNPEDIIHDLKAGMTFADIGCGDGFFSILAAKIVGEEGRVYAVDVDPQAIKTLETKAKAEALSNIIAEVGEAEETVFCSGCVDLVFYSMDLHDFRDLSKVLLNAKRMLKPSGYLVDLDWKKSDMQFGPPIAIKFSEEHASNLIKNAGFMLINIREAGPYHYMIVAKPS